MPQPGQQAPEVVSGGGEYGVDSVALRAFEIIAVHAVVGFGVANDRFDGGAPFEIAFDRLGETALLAGEVNPELVFFRRIVAAISLVGDDAIRSFCPLSRRSFGSIKISDSKLLRKTGNHSVSIKSICKETDAYTPETGNIQYFQNWKKHCSAKGSEFFTGEYIK